MKTAGHRAYTSCTQAVHRFGASATIALALVGCASGPPSGDGAAFRNLTAPIGVTSRYDNARFAGVWHVRGAYPRDADLVEVQRLGADTDDVQWSLVSRDCPAAGACQRRDTRLQAEVDQPGADRLRTSDGTTYRAVVLWVDEGFRTAAVGDPSGAFAWVLDRKPRGGADRITAARQLLEFSGFDLSAMEMRP